MPQIVVDLLGNDRLSPVFQDSLATIDKYNTAVMGMKSPNFKGDSAGFKAYNQELAQILRERRDILERASKDWKLGSLTTSEREDQARLQHMVDVTEALARQKRKQEATYSGLGSSQGMAGTTELPFQATMLHDNREQRMVLARQRQLAFDRDQASKDRQFQQANSGGTLLPGGPDPAKDARRQQARDRQSAFDRDQDQKDMRFRLDSSRRISDQEDAANVQRQMKTFQAERETARKITEIRSSVSHQRQVDSVGLLKRQTPEQWRARGGSGGNPQILPQTTQDMDRLAASTQKFQMVGMQAAFAVDDFIAGFQTGGITGGLRGAANNISMIGMQLGGLKGLVIGVGVAAAASLVATLWKSWADGAESAAQSVSRVAKELDYLRETQKTVFEPQKRELSPEEHRFNADEMAPRANRDRQKDVEAELAQRQENQKALNQNAKRLENAKEKQDRELSNVFFGTTKDPFDKQGRMGSLEHQKDFLADNDSNPDRMKEWGVKDPEKMLERQKTLIDMTKDSEAASKAVVENEKQLNSLLEEQQALRVSMPVAVQREADAAAKEVQQEQESQQRKQDALERKVQAELRRDRRASDKKLTAQDQLDDLVTGENDPQAGILIEMKDRLDIAKQITDEARRLKAIEGIKESALNKLAKDELDGKPKESTERRLAGTYTRGSVDAYRVIQTAGAASRQTPDTKHLAAIQKLNAEQRDLLQSLVDKTAAEPLEVVGN